MPGILDKLKAAFGDGRTAGVRKHTSDWPQRSFHPSVTMLESRVVMAVFIEPPEPINIGGGVSQTSFTSDGNAQINGTLVTFNGGFSGETGVISDSDYYYLNFNRPWEWTGDLTIKFITDGVPDIGSSDPRQPSPPILRINVDAYINQFSYVSGGATLSSSGEAEFNLHNIYSASAGFARLTISVAGLAVYTSPINDPVNYTIIISRGANAPTPDIAMGAVSISSDGQSVDASYSITGSDLPAASTIGFYWATGSGFASRIGSTPVSFGTATKAQSSYDINIPITALGPKPANATHILAVADSPDLSPTHNPSGIISEASESNNVKYVSIPPPPPPDVTDIRLDDATTDPNFLDISIEYSILEADAQPFSLHAYLSEDENFDPGIDTVLTGQVDVTDPAKLRTNADGSPREYTVSLQRTSPHAITRDRRFIIIVADPENKVPEQSESNNEVFVIPIFSRDAKGGFALDTDRFGVGIKEEKAVEPINGRISRGTDDFSRLVDISAIWRDGGGVFPPHLADPAPYAGDDFLVQPSLTEPLQNLISLAQAAKTAGRLNFSFFSINDAFDEEIDHAENSTHYEGRAIDLDSEPTSLAKLTGIAMLAGFDWVWHEPERDRSGNITGTHLHVSQRGFAAESSLRTLTQALDFGYQSTPKLIASQQRYDSLRNLLRQIEEAISVYGPVDNRKIYSLFGDFIGEVRRGIAAGEIRQGFSQRGSKNGLLIHTALRLQSQYKIR